MMNEQNQRATGGCCGSCSAERTPRVLTRIEAADFDGCHLTRRGTWLVRFSAPGCLRCSALTRTLEEVAGTRGDLGIGTIDVDRVLVERLGILSTPTLVLFHDGREIARTVGTLTADELTAWLGEALRRAVVR